MNKKVTPEQSFQDMAKAMVSAAEAITTMLPQVVLALQGIEKQLAVQSFSSALLLGIPPDPIVLKLMNPDGNDDQDPTISQVQEQQSPPE